MGIQIGVKIDELDDTYLYQNCTYFENNLKIVIQDINLDKFQEYLNAFELVNGSTFQYDQELIRLVLEVYVNNMYNEDTMRSIKKILHNMYSTFFPSNRSEIKDYSVAEGLRKYTRMLCKEVFKTKDIVIDLDMLKDIVKDIETYSIKVLKGFLLFVAEEAVITKNNINKDVFEYILTYAVSKETKPYIQGKVSLEDINCRNGEYDYYDDIVNEKTLKSINRRTLSLLLKHDSIEKLLLEFEKLDKEIQEIEGSNHYRISAKELKKLIDRAKFVSSYQSVINVMFKENKLKYFDRYLPKKEREYYYENYPEKFI
jgi:hypothetical protein